MSQHFRWTIPLSLAILFAGPFSAPAQEPRKGVPPPPATLVATDDVHVAPVIVDGETLFSVRGVTARPADRRAAEIAYRIRAVAENRKISPASLTLDDTQWTTWIVADGQRIMGLTDEDAALEDIARRPLAELYRARIGESLEFYRHRRQASVLWLH